MPLPSTNTVPRPVTVPVPTWYNGPTVVVVTGLAVVEVVDVVAVVADELHPARSNAEVPAPSTRARRHRLIPIGLDERRKVGLESVSAVSDMWMFPRPGSWGSEAWPPSLSARGTSRPMNRHPT